MDAAGENALTEVGCSVVSEDMSSTLKSLAKLHSVYIFITA